MQRRQGIPRWGCPQWSTWKRANNFPTIDHGSFDDDDRSRVIPHRPTKRGFTDSAWFIIPVSIVGLVLVVPLLAVWVPVRLLMDRLTTPRK